MQHHCIDSCPFLFLRRTSSQILFPYTTLFRSPALEAELAASLARELEVRDPQLARVPLKPVEGRLGQRPVAVLGRRGDNRPGVDRKSTRLNSSHPSISYAVFCLKKKNKHLIIT